MSKKEFNPYRDMLDIPSLIDENPTDYQLLGVDDFEGDSGKIAAAYEKRMQRIAELYQVITNMSQQIDAARDRVSDSQKKEEYDGYLRKTGRAGVARLGKIGVAALLTSFVLSIVTVVVATFYIYPMVVTIPSENYGDSVAALPNYNETQTQKEIEILKVQQEDVSTMDVNFNLPFNVDADSSVDFVDLPASNVQGEETALDDLPDANAALNPDEATDQQPEAMEDPATPEEPAVPEEPTKLEDPAVEEPSVPEEQIIDEPATPEEPTKLEAPAVEEPAVTEPSVPEETVELEAPDVEPPAVEEPAAVEPVDPEEATIVKPSEESPDIIVDPGAPETPAAPNDSDVPSVPDVPGVPDVPSVPVDLDTPTVPKMSSSDNAGIPELPPLDEVAGAELPIAPEPPMIPELLEGSRQEAADNAEFGIRNSELRKRSSEDNSAFRIPNSELKSGIVLEDVDEVDKLVQFVQMGQKAHTDADFTQLIFSARQAEEDLMKEKMFQKAQQIADVVYAACARCADKTYRSEALRQKEFVSKRSRLWEYVSSAESKMASEGTVSSSEANIVARWKIEIENDWQAGLNYLLLSDNEQVRNAAKNEIDANPADVRNVLTVANSWWNLSQDPIPMQQRFRERASAWYAKALPFISDKQIRILVEKRISMAER